MRNLKQKVFFLLLISFFLIPFLNLETFALEIPKKPIIRSVDAFKTKNPSDPSKFKIYLENYNQDFLKVQQSGNRFRTKVYIFEEDSIILQPEIKEYKPDIEIKTTQAIDLGKKYYAQVEFISYNPGTYKIEDSKKSDMVEFFFAAEIKAEDKKQDASNKPKDISKVYINAPKILEGKYVNEGNKSKISLKLADYNQVYSELKNNSNFVGEIVITERYLNTSKVVGKIEFTDYGIHRDFYTQSALTSNNEYVAIARFASDNGNGRVYGYTSNEFILKERLNTQKYTKKEQAKHLLTDAKTFLFPNEEGLIEPDRQITRGEVALALYSLLTERVKADNFTKNNIFTDSIPTKYTEAVSTMAKMRVINGYEDGSFKPNNPITRAELIAVIMKFYNNTSAPNVPFKDVSSTFWAKESINKAVSLNLINGYSDGSFKPNNPITRAEFAKIMNRVTGRVGFEDQTKNRFIDNSPEKWYYEEIKAAN